MFVVFQYRRKMMNTSWAEAYGGAPTGSFGGATVQVATSGALGLNNGGDSVIIYDGDPNSTGTRVARDA